MKLPKGHTELSSDERQIKGVCGPHEGIASFWVHYRGITKIEAYDEVGQMSHVPWIAIFQGDKITVRLPADQVAIHYF